VLVANARKLRLIYSNKHPEAYDHRNGDASMNDPILAPAAAAHPKAAQAQEHVFSGMTTNGPQRLWRIGGVLLLVLLLAVMLAP
jgi:hypothetical protein